MAAEATTTLATAPGVPEKITNAQTVCNRRNEKNKLCNGHIKQLHTGGEEATKHLRGDDVLFKCQSCGTLYMGPPLGHVRDVDKQQRFVEKELAALLKAAGGSLPAIRKNDKGVYVLAEVAAPQHAPAPKPAATAAKPATAAAQAATPAPAAKPASHRSPSETEFGPIPGASGPVPGETPEQKLARLKAVVAEAKRRKALLEGEEGAAPATPTARPAAATTATAAAPPAPAEAKPPAPSAADLGPIPGASGPVPGETPEQKLARLKAVVAEAKRRKALLEGDEAAAAGATQPAARTTPTAATTSGTDSSAQADAHRPAAEAQAATGMASAAPLSPAAATASPVAGPESPEDLAPDTVPRTAAPAEGSANDLGPIPGADGPVPGETHEEKIARLQRVVAEAKRRKALLEGE